MPERSFAIQRLGHCKVSSPIALDRRLVHGIPNFVQDHQRLIYQVETDLGHLRQEYTEQDLLELAGPRAMIYFEPSHVHAAIVTCGGLCPGLNDVIRAIVMTLWYGYGVRRISGIRYGYRGFLPETGLAPMELSPDVVMDIHNEGGTILGSSRGYGDRIGQIVDTIEQMGINIIFPIGGDGTQKGALNICKEIGRRGLKVAVVGVPKTIDNDLSYVQRSFGFETAVQMAVEVVAGAHNEARGALNGIGIVKLMGRQSGFIAAYTALASNDVNFCLIPEVPFDMLGERGLLAHLERRLQARRHALIVVAEGAGQDLIGQDMGIDASGNKILADIGTFLRDSMAAYFKNIGMDVTIRYIDPSYVIRSAPANATDSIYCTRLGTHAVHAAMSG
ncbi:MAG: ATP-dependent 6-phosphofructokinase, partial [Sedimentisphaerales bacterium]|nr:ATP-dependent 6-phosphofructokinase [Sedimentisphaerales bacterium]